MGKEATMSDLIQVVRVDGIPLGPLEEIQAIIMQYTDRLGYVLELTERTVGRGDPVWPARFYISKPVPMEVVNE